jgi:hypothetical protein
MMLDSKDFSCSEWEDVNAFIAPYLTDPNIVVRVQVKRRTEKRMDKDGAQNLLATLINKHGHGVWKAEPYRFDFVKGIYLWDNEKINITLAEQLFLYRWLVLKIPRNALGQHCLANLRRRCGMTFLVEITSKEINNV